MLDNFVDESVHIEHAFTIPDGQGGSVAYQLVGRVVFRADHFVSEVMVGDQMYYYNDMDSGKLREKTPASIVAMPSVLIVYHRITGQSSTRTTESITNDFVHIDDDLNPNTPTALPSPVTTPRPFPMPPPINDEQRSSPNDSPESGILWNIDCDGCAVMELTSGDATEAMIQCDTCDGWSHVRCMKKRGLSKDWAKPSFNWQCPTCADKEVWTDERYIVQYMLFQSGKGGRYYAARIVERQGDRVKLKWHEENIYSRGDKPSSPIFYKSTDKCVEERQNIKDYG
ncbi:hypothetical protein PILCRDRAFT_10797, partial [Piloderma croceum F 1598]